MTPQPAPVRNRAPTEAVKGRIAAAGGQLTCMVSPLVRWALPVYIAACPAAALYYSLSKPSAGILLTVVAAATIALALRKVNLFPAAGRLTALPFVAGFMLRILTLAIPNAQVSDFKIFEELAESIAGNTGFSYIGKTGLAVDVAAYMNNPRATPPVPTAFRLPGYPLLLSVAFHLLDDRVIAAKLLNCVLQLITALALYSLLRRRGNARSGLIAVWLWALYPSSVFFTALSCTEIAFTSLLLSSALVIDIVDNGAARKKRLPAALLCGLCCGAVLLVRPASQVLFCAVATLALVKIPLRLKLPAMTLFCAGLLIPLCLWGLRNQRTLGHFELQTTEMGLGFHTLTRELLPPRLERSVDSLTALLANSSDEFDRARLGREIGVKRFRLAIVHGALPGRMAQNHLKAWREDNEFDWIVQGITKRSCWPKAFSCIAFANLCWYLLILLLACFGAVDRAQSSVPATAGMRFLTLSLLASGLLFLLFEGQPRYHFPLMTVLMLFAAQGASRPAVPAAARSAHVER